MFESIITSIVLCAAVMVRTIQMASSLLELRAVDFIPVGLAIFWQSRAAELALSALLLFSIAYPLFLELGNAFNRITTIMRLFLRNICAALRAYLLAVFLEIASALSCPSKSDIFAMVGSFPTAPGIVTVALLGGGTISAVTNGTDFESVRRYLIGEYQRDADAQIQRMFPDQKYGAAAQQERDEQQRKLAEEARRPAPMSTEEWAIAQRNRVNPHQRQCPLTWKLHATCHCYVSAPLVAWSPRKPSGFQYGRQADSYVRARPLQGPRYRMRAPPAPPAAKEPYVYSAEDSEAALAKLRIGLKLSGPRTTPGTAFPFFSYDWTNELCPEVKDFRARNSQAPQAQAQCAPQQFGQGFQSQEPAFQQYSGTGCQQYDHLQQFAAMAAQQNPPAAATTFSAAPTATAAPPAPAPAATWTPATAPSTAAQSAPPAAQTAPPAAQTASIAAATQPIRSVHAPPPNGVAPSSMTPSNGPPGAAAPSLSAMGSSSMTAATSAGPAPSQGSALTTTAPTAPATFFGPSSVQSEAPTTSASPFSSAAAPVQTPAAPPPVATNIFGSAASQPPVQVQSSAPGALPLVFAQSGNLYPDVEKNYILNCKDGKKYKDRMVVDLLLDMFRSWRNFDHRDPHGTIKNLKLKDAIIDLLKQSTILHQFVGEEGKWSSKAIRVDVAGFIGVKGLEWERIKREFGAYNQTMVGKADGQIVNDAWVAFDGLDRIVHSDIVGLTAPVQES